MQEVFQSVDIEVLVALQHYQIMPVPLVVAEKQVFAMRRLHIFPVLESFLYCRERGMGIEFLTDAVLCQEVQRFLPSGKPVRRFIVRLCGAGPVLFCLIFHLRGFWYGGSALPCASADAGAWPAFPIRDCR